MTLKRTEKSTETNSVNSLLEAVLKPWRLPGSQIGGIRTSNLITLPAMLNNIPTAISLTVLATAYLGTSVMNAASWLKECAKRSYQLGRGANVLDDLSNQKLLPELNRIVYQCAEGSSLPQ